MNTAKLIYNGRLYCSDSCSCGCPIAELSADGANVIISDPAKPQNGTITMTVAEYNALLANAKPVV